MNVIDILDKMTAVAGKDVATLPSTNHMTMDVNSMVNLLIMSLAHQTGTGNIMEAATIAAASPQGSTMNKFLMAPYPPSVIEKGVALRNAHSQFMSAVHNALDKSYTNLL